MIERYRWAEADAEVLSALTIALIEPISVDVLAVLRPRRELSSALTVQGALDHSLTIPDFAVPATVAQVDELDGWKVVIEPNGWICSMEGPIAELSVGGRAMSAFWNVNAVMSVAVAQDGRLVRMVDPLLGDGGGTPMPEEAGLGFGTTETPRAASLTFLERLSGVAISQDWLLGRSRSTYEVLDPGQGAGSR